MVFLWVQSILICRRKFWRQFRRFYRLSGELDDDSRWFQRGFKDVLKRFRTFERYFGRLWRFHGDFRGVLKRFQEFQRVSGHFRRFQIDFRGLQRFSSRDGMLIRVCAKVSGISMKISCTMHIFSVQCHPCSQVSLTDVSWGISEEFRCISERFWGIMGDLWLSPVNFTEVSEVSERFFKPF